MPEMASIQSIHIESLGCCSQVTGHRTDGDMTKSGIIKNLPSSKSVKGETHNYRHVDVPLEFF